MEFDFTIQTHFELVTMIWILENCIGCHTTKLASRVKVGTTQSFEV